MSFFRVSQESPVGAWAIICCGLEPSCQLVQAQKRPASFRIVLTPVTILKTFEVVPITSLGISLPTVVFMRLCTLAIYLLLAAPVYAETCKYVDKDGHVTYSNVPVDNARKLSCVQAPPPIATDKPAAPATPQQADRDAIKPPVDVTVKKDANERRRLLEEELTREQEALAKARTELAQQETIRLGDERNYARVLERLKPYHDAVAAHEKRIDSIKQELANLK